MDALNRHRKSFYRFVKPTLDLVPPVRSEGGQDCQKAQDEAQANDTISSTGLSFGNSTGRGPPDSAGSFVAVDLNNYSSIADDYRYGVKAEADPWMGGVLV